jgi:hypothetical protein
VAAYRDFLAATEGDPGYSEQRQAALQLLGRLERGLASLRPAERR